jgi:hypothetical protein
MKPAKQKRAQSLRRTSALSLNQRARRGQERRMRLSGSFSLAGRGLGGVGSLSGESGRLAKETGKIGISRLAFAGPGQ